MTPEELKALLAAAANADTAPEALTQLSDKVTGLINTNAQLTKEKQDADSTIASLRDTNMRLFLRTTGVEHTEEEPKKIQDMNRNELKEFFSEKMKEATDAQS